MTDNGENTEKILRRLLFIRHGCPSVALYGDDGEMSCNRCGIDFRRMPASEIERIWHAAAMQKLAAAQSAI